jgi:hypothetical protein
MYYCPVWPKSRRARPKTAARANPMLAIRKIRWCGRIRTSVRRRCLERLSIPSGDPERYHLRRSCDIRCRFDLSSMLLIPLGITHGVETVVFRHLLYSLSAHYTRRV